MYIGHLLVKLKYIIGTDTPIFHHNLERLGMCAT